MIELELSMDIKLDSGRMFDANELNLTIINRNKRIFNKYRVCLVSEVNLTSFIRGANNYYKKHEEDWENVMKDVLNKLVGEYVHSKQEFNELLKIKNEIENTTLLVEVDKNVWGKLKRNGRSR